MDANRLPPSHGSANGSAPPADPAAELAALQEKRRMTMYLAGGVSLFLLIVGLAVWGLTRDAALTANLRDVFIIFMAFETLLIGFVLVILIVQLARLINLLQNEIKPILDSTNETVSTMRGTVTFISDNLAEPVVKVNEYFAAFSEFRKFFRALRGK
jgi:hypothetical protein